MQKDKNFIERNPIVLNALGVALGAFLVWFGSVTFGWFRDIINTPFSVPPGVVVTSIKPCHKLDGKSWKPYIKATGRFIVGAGTEIDPQYHRWTDPVANIVHKKLTYHTVQEIGGQELVTLKGDQLPTHWHQVYPHSGYQVDGNEAPATTDDHKGKGSYAAPDNDPGVDDVYLGKTSEVGMSKAHYNLPPFLALFYCVKGPAETTEPTNQ